MLKFLMLRLKHASLPELCYRARQRARGAGIRRMVARRLLPLGIAPVSPEVLLGLALPVFRPEGSPAEVQGILSGERFTLNTDRYTLRQWEAELSGRGGAGGAGTPDIRAVWEPARLQHVTLLLAYLSGREEGENLPAVREFARQELLGWLDANPFLQGPHYRSAMECALRIPVFFYAMKLLDNLSPAESTRVGEAAYAHALWVEANLSLHSSRGNHTVCEAAGLVFGGAMFRDAERGRHWLARGIALLGEELVRQVLDDGGALEQSLSYHRFVLDLYWLTADFLERPARLRPVEIEAAQGGGIPRRLLLPRRAPPGPGGFGRRSCRGSRSRSRQGGAPLAEERVPRLPRCRVHGIRRGRGDAAHLRPRAAGDAPPEQPRPRGRPVAHPFAGGKRPPGRSRDLPLQRRALLAQLLQGNGGPQHRHHRRTGPGGAGNRLHLEQSLRLSRAAPRRGAPRVPRGG